MASHSTHHCLGLIARLALMIVVTGGVMSRPALAQAKKAPGKAAAVFDDEKKTPDTKGATPCPTATRSDSARKTSRPR